MSECAKSSVSQTKLLAEVAVDRRYAQLCETDDRDEVAELS